MPWSSRCLKIRILFNSLFFRTNPKKGYQLRSMQIGWKSTWGFRSELIRTKFLFRDFKFESFRLQIKMDWKPFFINSKWRGMKSNFIWCDDLSDAKKFGNHFTPSFFAQIRKRVINFDQCKSGENQPEASNPN